MTVLMSCLLDEVPQKKKKNNNNSLKQKNKN